MKVYTSNFETWELRSWIPSQPQPQIVYLYNINDLDIPSGPRRATGLDMSAVLIKNNPVTRVARTSCQKRRRPKGGKSIRRC